MKEFFEKIKSAGILISIIILAFLFTWSGWAIRGWGTDKPSPKPTATPGPIVNVSPGPTASNVVKQDVSGQSSVVVPWVYILSTPAPTATIKPGESVAPAPMQTPYTKPINGSILGVFYDKKTGAYLGSQSQPLNGIITATKDQNGLNIDYMFNSTFNFSVNTQNQKVYPWTASAGVKADHHGIYPVAGVQYQKQIIGNRLTWSAGGEIPISDQGKDYKNKSSVKTTLDFHF